MQTRSGMHGMSGTGRVQKSTRWEGRILFDIPRFPRRRMIGVHIYIYYRGPSEAMMQAC